MLEPASPIRVPETYSTGGDAAGRTTSLPRALPRRMQPWWQGLDNEELNELIALGLRSSSEVQIAWARMNRARALALQARSPRFPQVSIDTRVNRVRVRSASLGASDATSAAASLPVSWEVDWFNRLGQTAQAARLDVEAAELDARGAMLSLSAEIAEAWLDLAQARIRQRLLGEQQTRNEALLELIVTRYEAGLASPIDMDQQRQVIVAGEIEIENAHLAERVSRQQISTLVGVPAAELGPVVTPNALVPPFRPIAGVPADLLSARPDVLAAAHRVQAADRRAAAALAEWFPRLILSGSIQYTWQRSDGGSFNIEGTEVQLEPATAQGIVWDGSAILSIPIFDGGLRRGSRRVAQATLDEAIEHYAQVVTGAIAEAETALAREDSERRIVEQVSRQVEIAAHTVSSARDRYEQGLTGYVQLADAFRTHQQSELALVDANRRLFSARIQLFRALAGQWLETLEAPALRESPPRQ